MYPLWFCLDQFSYKFIHFYCKFSRMCSWFWWLFSVVYLLFHWFLWLFKSIYSFYFNTYVFKFYLFMYLAVQGLHCCLDFFSSWGEGGPHPGVVRGFLTIATSCCRAQAPGSTDWSICGVWAQELCSQALELSLRVVGQGSSCSMACSSLDQGLNLCPLHWQHLITTLSPGKPSLPFFSP